MTQGKQYNILLIEADASLRWVISFGLRQHDMRVIEARSPREVATLETQRPDLLILDIDTGTRSDWSQVEAAYNHPQFADVPIVVLSWEPVPAQKSSIATMLQVVYHAKPFDARALYTTIEQLLYAQAEKEAVLVAKAEELLLASYTAHTPSASIWPVITAAGLLLALSGMMLNIFFIILGCMIMLVALLLWTLGTPSPTPQRLTAHV